MSAMKTNCIQGGRREGAYSSIYWWIVKLGLSASLVMSGVLLQLTGFDEDLIGPQSEFTIYFMRIMDIVVPAASILMSIYFMRKFPLTEAKVYEIRQELDRKKESAA